MKKTVFFPFLIFCFLTGFSVDISAQEEELIEYYQMEPLDDSLFVQIQEEVFIDPPDPKAEIIVDLRDPNNQTVSIKGTLYPFLAFSPETRARIQTYPFKLNLEENIHYASVFTRVIEKMRFGKLVSPPSSFQISPTLYYINPFLQLYGGERFGFAIKEDIGLSFGVGTPYSGAHETNFIETSFHILGFHAGLFSNVDALIDIRSNDRHNNLYTTFGVQFGYVIPLGNFFEFWVTQVTDEPSKTQIENYRKSDTENLKVKILEGEYYNFEFRYPIEIMGSTRSKFYVARYLNEWHLGYTGRELSLAGSTFDFRFDGMVDSDIRQPQYVFEIMVQQIFGYWAFSALSIGPSVVLSTLKGGSFGLLSLFVNARVKIGTSL